MIVITHIFTGLQKGRCSKIFVIIWSSGSVDWGGNVGTYLLPKAACGTFLSKDGGRTWIEIAKGA